MQNKNSSRTRYPLPFFVLHSKDLTLTEKTIGLHIYNSFYIKDKCNDMNETLSKSTHFSVRTISRALNSLEAKGYIVRRGKSFMRKFYLGSILDNNPDVTLIKNDYGLKGAQVEKMGWSYNL
jgi:hypothetical protein